MMHVHVHVHVHVHDKVFNNKGWIEKEKVKCEAEMGTIIYMYISCVIGETFVEC